MTKQTSSQCNISGNIIFHCYPGGNNTYIGVGFQDSKHKYLELNRKFLSSYAFLEQGGFIEKSNISKTVGRFNMAGGEFCGNGARSFIALVATDYAGGKRLSSTLSYEFIQISEDNLLIPFTTSGFESIIVGKAKLYKENTNKCWVELQMPIPDNGIRIEKKTVNMDGKQILLRIVSLPGITHLVVDVNDFHQCDKKTLLKDLIQTLDLTNELAVGLIISKLKDDKTQIEATVYVSETQTLYEESACGSGTLAAAIVEMRENNAEKYDASILQPSGTSLQVSIAGNWIENVLKISTCHLAGDVEILGEL